MQKSTARLSDLLNSLTSAARQAGWSDAEWARRSGLPKETLCRLRSRSTCDFATLDALARSVGATLTVHEGPARTSANGLWPSVVDRRLEARLVDVLRTGTTRPEDWRPLGPPFFLAGLAVTLASVPQLDRRTYLDRDSVATIALPADARSGARPCGLSRIPAQSTWPHSESWRRESLPH
jgi:hypothetical protein